MPLPDPTRTLNPWGEVVRQAPDGQRWVRGPSGWEAERPDLPVRWCRAPMEDPYIWLMHAWRAHPQPRPHPVELAAWWAQRPGQPVPQWPPARRHAIQQACWAEQGWRATQALLEGAIWEDETPWPALLDSPSLTAIRGVQWGLWRELRMRGGLWRDVGAIGAWDIAGTEEAWVVQGSTEVGTPPHRATAHWWEPPRGFQVTPTPGAWVLWYTPQTVQGHPGQAAPLLAWAQAIKQGRPAVVVTQANTTEEVSWLAAMAGHKAESITIPGKTVYRLYWYGLAPPPAPASLLAWAQPAWQAHGARSEGFYQPRSRLPASDARIAPRLALPVRQALDRLPQADHLDAWVAERLGAASLDDILSAEQADAVALALSSLDRGEDFVLADETGFGKGRTLMSVAAAALREGRPVLMVTENAPLFSDWMRDGADLGLQWPLPHLLHHDAVVRTPQGEVITSVAAQKKRPAGHAPWVFTTYAQLARFKADNERGQWLTQWMGGRAWIVLDEAHNAVGDSAVAASLEILRNQARATLHVSATFAKHEGNLVKYLHGLAGATQLTAALRHDPQGVLRESLTWEMARDGRWIRREHPPMPPPDPFWVPMTPELAQQIQAFADVWQALFAWVRHVEAMQGKPEAMAWVRLGGLMARTSKEWSMWAKLDALVDSIETCVRQDEKVVVVVDSTLEAALLEACGVRVKNQEESERFEQEVKDAPCGTGPLPSWRRRWELLVANMYLPEALAQGTQPDQDEQARLLHRVGEALQRLPEWPLTPLDTVQERLAARGIRCDELSGRRWTLRREGEAWKLVPRRAPDRQATVRAFNQGECDVLLLTRAGAAGISLHASRKFADQRRRVLLEWDLTPNPVNRRQFWGRVRRRDQVCEPRYAGLVVDTLSERRIWAREARKQGKLSAHLGQAGNLEGDLYLPSVDSAIREWSGLHPKEAKWLGVHHDSGAEHQRIDRLLGRSWLLPPAQQQEIWERLRQAQQASTAPAPPEGLRARALRRERWAGQGEGMVEMVERAWSGPARASLDQVKAWVAARRPDQRPAVEHLARWQREQPIPQAWQTFLHQHWAPLKVGSAVRHTDGVTGWAMPAVCLGFCVPEAGQPWGLTQVGVELHDLDGTAPYWRSLYDIWHDKQWAILGPHPQPSWWELPQRAKRGWFLEGPILTVGQMGSAWGVGQPQWVEDPFHGVRPAWALPPSLGEGWRKWPRDLLGVDEVVAYWRAHPQHTLALARPWGETIELIPIDRQLLVHWNEKATDAADWVAHNISRRLGRGNWVTNRAGERRWENRVARNDVRGFLHVLALAGQHWRAPVDP